MYVHGYNEFTYETESYYQVEKNGTFQIFDEEKPLNDVFLEMTPLASRKAHKTMKITPYHRRFYEWYTI